MTITRLRLDLAYDGTDFHGWAKQSGGLRTVQGVIEAKLALIAQAPVELTVAGRTDAGVHATGQVAHVDVPCSVLSHRSVAGDPARLVGRLAKLLPEDIRIQDVSLAPAGFDARFSALRRHYVYRVTTNAAGALPLRARDTATWLKEVDVDLMQETANHLVGLHDFAAFCKHKPHATTIRDVQSFAWHDVSTKEEPELFEAHISADAFCWSMVRSLVGACLAVGEGRKAISFPLELLGQRNRSSQCPVAPAKGLTLVRVDYPDDTSLADRAVETRGRRTL
ncbi:pseudouridine synthase [Corynebacterium phocae]|uniref:tRNA pseudouridine synthase A n=1 Tax=Corynebacterium phocae TaxID=161895 RepID=A0A1L7D590_9CORY|nr:tRNA pseudouridine(38-40) synthase TruA [Corynebacterium phocae]APT93211.1 pseudouridine synthase [Corynebacterium phocae]KAA8721951.1 tRNA pseudouridine(38-40) synthase TruA [Corynebacterium phocae]